MLGGQVCPLPAPSYQAICRRGSRGHQRSPHLAVQTGALHTPCRCLQATRIPKGPSPGTTRRQCPGFHSRNPSRGPCLQAGLQGSPLCGGPCLAVCSSSCRGATPGPRCRGLQDCSPPLQAPLQGCPQMPARMVACPMGPARQLHTCRTGQPPSRATSSCCSSSSCRSSSQSSSLGSCLLGQCLRPPPDPSQLVLHNPPGPVSHPPSSDLQLCRGQAACPHQPHRLYIQQAACLLPTHHQDRGL